MVSAVWGVFVWREFHDAPSSSRKLIPAMFFFFLVVATLWNVEPRGTGAAPLVGSAQAIGHSLFTDYLLPFEVTSLLILIALVGAVIFAKKDI